MTKLNSILGQLSLRFDLQSAWLGAYLGRYKKILILVLFLGLLTCICAGALMFTSGYLISSAATQPENILLIYLPVVLTRVFGIARPGFHYVERLLSHNFILRLTSDLRVRLYQALEPDAARERGKHKTGDILSVLADDIEHIQNLFLRIVFPSVVALLLYLVIVLAIGKFSVVFALLMLLWIGIMILLLPLVSLAANRARRYRQKELRNNLYRSLTDAVMGAGDWRFSGRQADFIAAYEEIDDRLRSVHAQSNRFSRRRDFLWQTCAVVIVVAVLLWVSNLVAQGNLGANWIAAFVFVAFPLIDAVSPIPEAFGNLPAYQDSLRRFGRLSEPTGYEAPSLSAGLIDAPITIRLHDLSFQYEKDQPVLRGLNLAITPGQKLAVLGPSGSGKSTLIKLIRGDLAPSAGTVCLNDIPSAIMGDATASLIGVLSQRPYLFDTTIGNNLRMGNPQASEAELQAVIAQAGLKELIAQLPLGLDTPVEEAGGRFSGGERQRIALARILLQKTPVVILDEPTIGLDPRMESELIATFFEGLSDKTIIWITHHLQGMEHMDNIVFLDEGRITLKGTHAQLWQSSERYRALYSMDNWGTGINF